MNNDRMFIIIAKILWSSLANLFKNQPDILNNTSQTNMTEWNFAHHLANEIAKYIFWLNHDLEVIKKDFNRERPDIIFHKRGTNDFNFLVVEIKFNRNRCEDIKKIKEHWMKPPLSYRFGVSFQIINGENWSFDIFSQNGEKQTITSYTFKTPLPHPVPEWHAYYKIQCLVDKIIGSNRLNKKADTTGWEQEMDMLVYELYGLTEEIKIIEGK